MTYAWSAFLFEARLQGPWIGWNLLLAVVPGLGALALFKWPRRRGVMWWAGAGVVALMLPNAPYVLTDLIHLRPDIHYAPSRAAVLVGVLPLFLVLFAGGVLSYSCTLYLLRKELQRRGWSLRRRVGAEALVDVVCAVGVALGRLPRLNSWDVLRPDRILAGLGILAHDPRSVFLSLVAIVSVSLAVEWIVSSAADARRARRHR